MGRGDKLSNEIYQRMKQLQSRVSRRNEEEKKRQEKTERAKRALWEEHQRQYKLFENHLKSMTPMPKKRPRTKLKFQEEMPQPVGQVTLIDLENSEASPLVQDEIVPYETSLTPPMSTPSSRLNSRHTIRLDTAAPTPDYLSVKTPQRDLISNASSQSLHFETEYPQHEHDNDIISVHSTNTISLPLSRLSDRSDEKMFSPPPSLPTSPSELPKTQFTPSPVPLKEPEPASNLPPPEPPKPDIPIFSITQLTTSSPDIIIEEETPKPPPPKKKKATKPKKKVKKAPRTDLKKSTDTLDVDKKMGNDNRQITKKQAQVRIKDIFKSVNQLPEEELTEEAFDIFLDTIKQLSEYVEDVDSQNFEVVDDISSGFTSRILEYCDDLSDRDFSPKTLDYQDSGFIEGETEKEGSERRKKRQERLDLALERRMMRTLVVREKQKDIVRYRKVTIAELRLRRQRALMRVRLKIADEVTERNRNETQRIQLVEMALLNERERRERQDRYKLEELARAEEELAEKKLRELRVKEELEQLLERSRQKQRQEAERMARQSTECYVQPEDTVQPLQDTDEDDLTQKGLTESEILWQNTARKAQNLETFNVMCKRTSFKLQKILIHELIFSEQKQKINDIPGFSYFLFIKYTMDPSEIEELMLDI